MSRPYIVDDFDVARANKWDLGRTHYRRLPDGSHRPDFVGDPVEEAFNECCDLFNYLEEAERQTGRSYAICRSQVRQIAAKLQLRWSAEQRHRAVAKVLDSTVGKEEER